MHKLITLVLIVSALGVAASPALAADSAAAVPARDTIALVAKPAKHDVFDGFVMPKYLTAQQEEDARLVAYEAMFYINHTP